MTSKTLNILLMSLFSVLSSVPSSPAWATLSDAPQVEDAIQVLDLWLKKQLLHQDLPGLTIGVVRDQELIWSKGYGFSDRASQTPMTPETLFRIGSITKLFTATAVLHLRDAGKLNLDDPIVKHLPWFRVRNTFEGTPPITVWNLLTHTAGITREGAFPYWTDHEFPSREAIIDALPNQPAIYEPSTTYKYSNLGMALLGEIVAAASGQSYESYVTEHLLKALGMTNSTLLPDASHHERRATSYMRRQNDGKRDIFDYYDTGALRSAANMVSSVEDLAHFAKLQFRLEVPKAQDEQILKGSTLREMQRVHWLYPSWKGGRGLGFSVSQRNGQTIVSHGGWIGGNRCHLILVPETQIAVIVMINADDGSPSWFGYRALDALQPAILSATQPPAAKRQADPVWQRYLGTYSDPWGWEYRALIIDEQLVFYESSYPPEDAPADGLSRLVPVSDHTFRMGDGELVIFEIGENGEVERVKRRYDYLYPVASHEGEPRDSGTTP